MQEIKKINLSLIEHLDNYLELITYGFTNPMPDSNEGPWKITAKDVINGKINYDTARKTTIDSFENDLTPKSKPKINDILLTKDGTLGRLAIVDQENICVNQSVAVLRPNKKIIPQFLYYLLSSPYYQKTMLNDSDGSVLKHIYITRVKKMDVQIPDLTHQKKIIQILELIDNKIDVLIKLNKNLEEQLLRIFDSWFLKFELSNEFSDSKLGLIPKGWKIDYLGSKKSCSIIKSGIDEFDNSKIYIATADVDNSIITSNDTLITMDDKPSRANMQPISNSIWFAKMIDSKKLIMVDEYCNDLLNNYIFSTGFCGLKCVDKYFYYLWTFLLTDVFDVMKNNFCTGTTMQAINNKDTKLIEFVLPDDKTITQFNSIAKPMFKKIYYNNLEIKKLQRLRDTLLPKLMSGEIDVSEVNCDLELKYNYMKYLFNQIHTPMSKSVV